MEDAISHNYMNTQTHIHTYIYTYIYTHTHLSEAIQLHQKLIKRHFCILLVLW